MKTIRIRQTGKEENHFQAVISFDDKAEYPVTITNPFSEENERLLEWYFEKYLEFPFEKEKEVRKAVRSIRQYGEDLFRQIFKAEDIRKAYDKLKDNKDKLCFEIVGSPGFHALHWEALKDPKFDVAWSLLSPMVRKNPESPYVRANVRPSPFLNILLVVARPRSEKDMGYRTISRPLVNVVHQARLRVNIHILRPGTYEALIRHLEDRDVGFYHVIHFDLHGELLTYEDLKKGHFLLKSRCAREEIMPYEGFRAFIFMEGEQENLADPVEAGELGKRLTHYQVPVVMLNACQSGKQIGENETNIGSHLMKAGVQTVLTMKYSFTVSAAVLMMKTLYRELVGQNNLSKAIRTARLELSDNPERKAYFNQSIRLQDWLLPVVWQNAETEFDIREFTSEEARAYFEKKANRYVSPKPADEFAGRDLNVLEIEKQILFRGNILLLRGAEGIGKTILLHHLGEWWQTTQFADEVFYFGYDKEVWNCQKIMACVAERLFSEKELNDFLEVSEKAKQYMLSEKLRAWEHLIILDNFEDLRGFQNPAGLTTEEQESLRQFLNELRKGKTRVLIACRDAEGWLKSFSDNLYELPGLDHEAVSALADRILEKYNVVHYKNNADFQELLKHLGGNTRRLERVLSKVEKQMPGEILRELKGSDGVQDEVVEDLPKEQPKKNESDDDNSGEIDPPLYDILKIKDIRKEFSFIGEKALSIKSLEGNFNEEWKKYPDNIDNTFQEEIRKAEKRAAAIGATFDNNLSYSLRKIGVRREQLPNDGNRNNHYILQLYPTDGGGA